MRPTFLDAAGAAALLDAGAVAIDARGRRAFRRGHLPGARRLDWKTLRDGWFTSRVTDDEDALARGFARVGIDGERPVLVYGAAERGSGQEGRVAWMLAWAGVPEVALLDGGTGAWREEGRPLETGTERGAPSSLPSVRHRDEERACLEDVVAAVRRGNARLFDVRSDREWRGATLHFERRGGRIPGARHLPWKGLLDQRGRIRAPAVVDALERIGIRPHDEVIVYCAGGVRAAFVWAVLRSLGWPRVRVYDGSFLEWARHAQLPVEAERRPLGRRALEAVGAAALIGSVLGVTTLPAWRKRRRTAWGG